ncbi:MAG: methylenetetrahydrofolate reductase [Candidatus Omnitrophica bacterium]|nr:methylenetetrahydrofolate reductase [Candidatus Omnitrophota bacterium]
MIKKISDILKKKERTLSFEFFPPKTQKGRLKLFETVLLLKDLQPDFVSVTYGAGGNTRELTLDVVCELEKRFGLSVMHHLTCIGHSLGEIEKIISQMREKGICNVLALYGDIPLDEAMPSLALGELKYCYQLCRLLRSYGDYFSIGVAGFPEGHINSPDKETDIKHLKAKLTSGGEFVITQLFFDNNDYFDYVKKIRKAGIAAKVIPGVLPITDYYKLLNFCQRCGAGVPELVHRLFKPIADNKETVYKKGVEFTLKQCRQLLAGGAPGLHFFTLNKADPAREIVNELRRSKSG